jgi:hypothetical protein
MKKMILETGLCSILWLMGTVETSCVGWRTTPDEVKGDLRRPQKTLLGNPPKPQRKAFGKPTPVWEPVRHHLTRLPHEPG